VVKAGLLSTEGHPNWLGLVCFGDPVWQRIGGLALRWRGCAQASKRQVSGCLSCGSRQSCSS